MVYGSVLAKFRQVTISTADEKKYELKINFINRIAIKLIGIPHLGFRLRAKLIFSIIDELSLNCNAKILDAGCGFGIYSFILAERKFQIDSIDLMNDRISAIKDRIREHKPFLKLIKPQQGSITQLPFRDNTFDLIICSEVIEHILEDKLAVKELSRVLSPQGHLILTTPTTSKHNQKVFKTFSHVRPGYTDKDYYDFASKYNLNVEKLIHYEFKLGSSMFVFQQMIKSKLLLGLTFYPLYLFSLLDLVIRSGEPNGVICLFSKRD